MFKNGQLSGWVLGWPIDENGLIEKDINAPDDEDILSWIHGLGGRFVLLNFDSAGTVFVDAGGTLGVVYDKSRQIIASTPTLITKEPNTIIEKDLGRPPNANWYPFGITSSVNVERLLPNHMLQLDTWQVSRHWAPPTVKAGNEQIRSSLIAQMLVHNINSVAAVYPLIMSLTAGRDSRALLACSRNVAADTIFFTRRIDNAAAMDDRFARRLARSLSLCHKSLPYEASTPVEATQWQDRTGYSVAGRWWQSYRSIKRLPKNRMFLPGLGFEVGRSYYWRDGDHANLDLNVETVLSRIRMPSIPILRERALDWLNGLPQLDAFAKLDLLYMEQRLGAWAGPLHYGLVESGLCLSPAIDRKILSEMLSLPHEYRRDQQLALDIIRSEWPELTAYPFNQSPLTKRFYKRIKRIAFSLKRAVF